MDSYDQQAAEIRDYYNQDLADDVSEGTSSGEDDSSKVIDTSPADASGLSFIDGQIDPALEEDLSDLQEFRNNFISLKTAMEQGRYRIYGVKLTLTGAQAQALLQSNKFRLREKLTIFPESSLSPLDPSEENGIKNMTFHIFAAIYCLLSFARNCTLSIVRQSVCV